MFACKHICVKKYICVYLEARAETSLECCSLGCLLSCFRLFIWGCILLLLLSLETGFLWTWSLPVRLGLLVNVPSCLYLPGPKIAGECLTTSFFMWVLEIKLWPHDYVVSTILTKPYLQTPACFCVMLGSRVAVLSDSLSDSCKYILSLQWHDQTAVLPFSLSFRWVLLSKTDSRCTNSYALCESSRFMDLCRFVHFPECKVEYLAYLHKNLLSFLCIRN